MHKSISVAAVSSKQAERDYRCDWIGWLSFGNVIIKYLNGVEWIAQKKKKKNEWKSAWMDELSPCTLETASNNIQYSHRLIGFGSSDLSESWADNSRCEWNWKVYKSRLERAPSKHMMSALNEWMWLLSLCFTVWPCSTYTHRTRQVCKYSKHWVKRWAVKRWWEKLCELCVILLMTVGHEKFPSTQRYIHTKSKEKKKRTHENCERPTTTTTTTTTTTSIEKMQKLQNGEHRQSDSRIREFK